MLLLAAVEAIGEVFLDGIMELLAKIPVAVWSMLRDVWQEFWR